MSPARAHPRPPYGVHTCISPALAAAAIEQGARMQATGVAPATPQDGQPPGLVLRFGKATAQGSEPTNLNCRRLLVAVSVAEVSSSCRVTDTEIVVLKSAATEKSSRRAAVHR